MRLWRGDRAPLAFVVGLGNPGHGTRAATTSGMVVDELARRARRLVALEVLGTARGVRLDGGKLAC
jgi:hypothetical protein